MPKNSIAKDTIKLTIIQLILQTLSLLLNIFMTRKLGSAAMGIASLIYTFFSFAIVLANGNIFLCANRFVSEEIGHKNSNPNKIFGYAVSICLVLSLTVAVGVFILAEPLGARFLKTQNGILSIRLLAISLPIGGLCSCMKGYFNAYRKVNVPAISDTLEFLIKAGTLAFFIEFLIPSGKMSVISAISFSILCGEISSFIFLFFSIIKLCAENRTSAKASLKFGKFILLTIPIALNSYISMTLSCANEALVPLTLKQFSNSTEVALSQYGIFEAIIIPTLFFPAVILFCLSVILISEISRERSAHNDKKVTILTHKAIRQTFTYSIFVVSILLVYGQKIGYLLSGDEFAGKMITILAPTVPFIYLEIILEGILKGLGKQNFSSLNYIAEYMIRISVLLIFVPLFGFYGLIISYYASNIVCNISRIIKITKTTEFSFEPIQLLIIPIFSAVFSWQIGIIISKIFEFSSLPTILEICIYTIITGAIYIFVQRVMLHLQHKRDIPSLSSLITANE